jgi:excinuclease ABC subunit A
VDLGNSVIVIEHNLDVIKTADYIIDIGPEGGEGGGTVVATGIPEEIVSIEKSYTGQYLRKVLGIPMKQTKVSKLKPLVAKKEKRTTRKKIS